MLKVTLNNCNCIWCRHQPWFPAIDCLLRASLANDANIAKWLAMESRWCSWSTMAIYKFKHLVCCSPEFYGLILGISVSRKPQLLAGSDNHTNLISPRATITFLALNVHVTFAKESASNISGITDMKSLSKSIIISLMMVLLSGLSWFV